jgi:GNAT superfamily N-acetyltransferase
MDPEIRLFQGPDGDEVVALSLRAWEPVFGSLEAVLGGAIFRRLHPDWRVDQARAVREVVSAGGHRAWVAVVDESVIGLVAVGLDTARSIGEIVMIAVDPGSQRRGVASQLTQVALDWMRDNEMTVAVVETGGDPGHAPARATYEKAGFTPLPIARYFRNL